MSFFQKTAVPNAKQEALRVIEMDRAANRKGAALSRADHAQRPALLDEKLKLHERIIDEFNLASLEKLPREDLVREVRAYLGELCADGAAFAQPERAASVRGGNRRRDDRVRADRAPAQGSDHQRYPDQHPQEMLCGTLRKARRDDRPFQGRSASHAHRAKDRRLCWAPDRRIVPDRRRPIA